MTIFGEHLIYLGYFGIAYASIGVVFLLYCLWKALVELKDKGRDGIWKVRVGLPIAFLILIYVFSYAIWTAVEKVIIDGNPGNEATNMYRFVIGSGLGIVGTMFLVIYRWGGQLLDYPHNNKNTKP